MKTRHKSKSGSQSPTEEDSQSSSKKRKVGEQDSDSDVDQSASSKRQKLRKLRLRQELEESSNSEEEEHGGGEEVNEEGEESLDEEGSEEDDDVFCGKCEKGDDPERLMLCDGCSGGWHTYCLSPPLPRVPRGDWFCPRCLPPPSSDAPVTSSPKTPSKPLKHSDFPEGAEVILKWESGDGMYYPVIIAAPPRPNEVLVRFADGDEEWVSRHLLFADDEAVALKEDEDSQVRSIPRRRRRTRHQSPLRSLSDVEEEQSQSEEEPSKVQRKSRRRGKSESPRTQKTAKYRLPASESSDDSEGMSAEGMSAEGMSAEETTPAPEKVPEKKERVNPLDSIRIERPLATSRPPVVWRGDVWVGEQPVGALALLGSPKTVPENVEWPKALRGEMEPLSGVSSEISWLRVGAPTTVVPAVIKLRESLERFRSVVRVPIGNHHLFFASSTLAGIALDKPSLIAYFGSLLTPEVPLPQPANVPQSQSGPFMEGCRFSVIGYPADTRTINLITFLTEHGGAVYKEQLVPTDIDLIVVSSLLSHRRSILLSYTNSLKFLTC